MFVAAASLGLMWRLGILNQPAAVRWSELDALIGARETKPAGPRRANRGAQKKALAERDHAEGEAEYWRAMVEEQKAEYESLGGMRREIEEVREAYRQAAENLGVKETELRQLTADLDAARRNLETVAEQRDEAEARLDEIAGEEEALKARQGELRDAVTALEGQVGALEEQKAAGASEIERHGQQLFRPACGGAAAGAGEPGAGRRAGAPEGGRRDRPRRHRRDGRRSSCRRGAQAGTRCPAG